MIIDLVLDRKEGFPYSDVRFYHELIQYGEVGFEIARAMDSGTEKDIQESLCDYIVKNDYNIEICEYIRSVKWLSGEVKG